MVGTQKLHFNMVVVNKNTNRMALWYPTLAAFDIDQDNFEENIIGRSHPADQLHFSSKCHPSLKFKYGGCCYSHRECLCTLGLAFLSMCGFFVYIITHSFTQCQELLCVVVTCASSSW